MRRQRPSRRRLRHCSLCFTDSSSLTSSAELGTLPFLAGPNDSPHSTGDDEHNEEDDGSASPAAAEGQAPRDGGGGAPPVLSGCLALLRNRCLSRGQGGGDGLVAALGRWRTASRTEKLQALWALEDQVASHLRRLESQLNPPLALFHVPRTLPPDRQPAIHVAAVTWLGGWRPSAILSAVPHLLGGAATLELSRRRRQFLDEAVRRFKVEEAVLDEETAELCSMGLLSLLAGAGEDGTAAVEGLRKAAERTQQLRYGALEIAVRRVMDAAQAAEFLLRFEGFQLALHRMGAVWNAGVGDLRLSLQQSSARTDH